MVVRSRNIAEVSRVRDKMSVSGQHQTSDGHFNEKWPLMGTIAMQHLGDGRLG